MRLPAHAFGVALALLGCAVPGPTLSAEGLTLTMAQAREIGRRIWKNECGGTVSGLTSWNKGEEFPSLGIGHFIWYPAGRTGPFAESFPGLVHHLERRGYTIPPWLKGACPWTSRTAFLRDLDGARMRFLRGLLVETIPQQAEFAALRLERALPQMLAAVPPARRAALRRNFYRVAAEPLGLYALMDYVNFKGEGTSPLERYAGQGWGLLQVLETMPPSGPALEEFARAADRVLTRRVRNSPPERHESQWLDGWRNRLSTYTR